MLGILGGMGPMATVDFMGKVIRNTPASCDQDHIQMIVCSATNVPDRTAAILGQGCDPFPAMLNAVQRLELSGATRIAIPCNTAHHWHGALQAETSVPILHIVDAVADALARQRMAPTVGVLATDGTVRAGVYQKRLAERGYICMMPDTNAQAEVMRAIRLVKAGQISEAAAIFGREAETLAAGGLCAHCHGLHGNSLGIGYSRQVGRGIAGPHRTAGARVCQILPLRDQGRRQQVA